MNEWSKPAKILSGIATAVGALAVILWGVPYYIGSQVRAQVAVELRQHDVPGIEETADGNKATLGAVLTQLEGMETRMIERDQMFIDYLERQAELARQRGQ